MSMFQKFDEYAHAWDTTRPLDWSWHQWAFAGLLAVYLAVMGALITVLILGAG